MKENKALKTISVLITISLVGLMVYFIKATNSDKSPIIFMFFYPLLLLLNLILLLIFWKLKKPAIIEIFKTNIYILFIMIVPMILFICLI
jgi:hypothetical protein